MFRELEDGVIEISYEDYNVEAFGGADYEAIYRLTSDNAEKLKDALEKENPESKGKNTLKELILKKFGENLEKASFANYCKTNNIKYDLKTFIH